MSMSAVSLNRYFDIHKDLLLKHQSSIMEDLNNIQIEESAHCQLLKAKSNLKLVMNKLTQDAILNPIKIMGIRMDMAFAAKIIAAMGSGIFAMLSIYLRS
jgi:hypothetical protein